MVQVGATRSVTGSEANVRDSELEADLFYRFASAGRNSPGQSLPLSLNKIAPEVLSELQDGKTASIVILLADQADVSAASKMEDQDARGWFVYKTLTRHAAYTQTGLKDFLKSRGIAFQSFWAVNMLVANADRTVVDLLASRDDVARIDSNRPARWIEDPQIAKPRPAPNTPEAAEWGVQNVNAPAAWALGFTGTGIVIGNQDTGMRWTHTAIKPKYRGWDGVTADHNFNWHDSIHSQIPGSPAVNPCGRDTVAPCDDNGHGTHTTGTTSGDDGAGNQIGVAPGAKWIGCRNMDQGNGTPATYSECFQFFIAPTDLNGNNANPSLRPHVMNNSWGCPVSEGCTTRAELETIVNNAQAAGIFVVSSAGNTGSGCSSVSDPPSIYDSAFSVGAVDISNTLANFSSRGPSTYYSPNHLKPNISAPGVGVRSCTSGSDTNFVSLNGTSMASPHVVGVVALLWSARPQLLRNIDGTKTLLQNSANPTVIVSPVQTCGGIASTQIPNNSFGYGRVDALAAINAVAPTASPAQIIGRIVTSSGDPIAGANVTAVGSRTIRAITNANGAYKIDNLQAGDFYTVTPLFANYSFVPANRSFTLVQSRTDAIFTGSPLAIEEINPLEGPEFFIRQHYLDFLGREPEQAGLDFWSDQLRACGSELACLRQRRQDISAAFFLSDEFEQTGGYVYRLYAAALSRRVKFSEFVSARTRIIENSDREAGRRLMAAWLVQQTEFTNRYVDANTAELFVDSLIQNIKQDSGVDLSSRRDVLIAAFYSGADISEGRQLVLVALAEDPAYQDALRNRAFVLVEYFGYLRRDPDANGYTFWLNILNQEAGNYRGMVCAFLNSSEYQLRFSTVILHSDRECQ